MNIMIKTKNGKMKHIKLFEEMHPDIGIDKVMEQETVEELNVLLANHFVLFMKIWNFHWIVVSKAFGPYHKLFNDLYDKFFNDIDGIAERIRMIGGKPLGTLAEMVELSDLDEFNLSETPNSTTMVEQTLADFETIIKEIRDILQIENLDNGTSKYLEDLIESHEKDAWILRPHLEER